MLHAVVALGQEHYVAKMRLTKATSASTAMQDRMVLMITNAIRTRSHFYFGAVLIIKATEFLAMRGMWSVFHFSS